VGTPSGTGVMKQICASVASEGGYQIPGYDFSQGNNATGKLITTTRTPVLAIRLKNTFNSKPNRRIVRLKNSSAFAISGNLCIEVVQASGITATTATWSDVENESGVEISTNISAYTAAHEHRIDSIYIASGNGGTGGNTSSTFSTLDHNSSISQNYASTQSQMFVVWATALSGTVTSHNTLTWTEFE
jgi:hypothetical protein